MTNQNDWEGLLELAEGTKKVCSVLVGGVFWWGGGGERNK